MTKNCPDLSLVFSLISFLKFWLLNPIDQTTLVLFGGSADDGSVQATVIRVTFRSRSGSNSVDGLRFYKN
ncbi:hypothetical protein HanRHA438_Chr02g0062641 [Helianthus annuus]|nr:hypothetical protein HanRHA438_Chr02g0062641 [Helianthus annuus]